MITLIDATEPLHLVVSYFKDELIEELIVGAIHTMKHRNTKIMDQVFPMTDFDRFVPRTTAAAEELHLAKFGMELINLLTVELTHNRKVDLRTITGVSRVGVFLKVVHEPTY